MYTEQIKYFMATLSKYQAERKKRSKMYKWAISPQTQTKTTYMYMYTGAIPIQLLLITKHPYKVTNL